MSGRPMASIGWQRLIPGIVLGMACILPAAAADLVQALQLARQNDATFQSARYAYEGMQQKIPEARANMLPNANLTSSLGHPYTDTTLNSTGSTESSKDMWSWSLQLSQPILRFGQIAAYREATFMVEEAQAQFDEARQDLLVRLADAYFNALVAQESMAAADAQIQALQEQLAQVQHGYEKGTHSITDVDETRSKLELARSQRVAAKNDLESQQAALEEICGQPLASIDGLTAWAHLPDPDPKDVKAWMDQARTNHPAVRAAKAAWQAAQQTVKKLRDDHLPTVDLVGSYGRYSNPNGVSVFSPDSVHRTREVGVQLNIPLYAGGGTSARVAEAVAGMQKADQDREAASRKAAREAQQAYAGAMNGQAQIAALEAAVESAQSAVKGNQVGYKLGIRINLDVLNAQQQLYTAKRDWAKARYDTLLQGLKLKAAAGILSDDDILGINALLQH